MQFKYQDLELISNITGNWDIYRFKDHGSSNYFILRIPKNRSSCTIDSYVKTHSLIKSLNIPTLKVVEKYEHNGKKGVKTEDINCQKDKIYVSYNSLYSDSEMLMHELRKSTLGIEEVKVSSEYEEFRYRNRIDEISNFDDFIYKTEQDLGFVSQKKIVIDFDSYFFGTERNSKESLIDYKIIDLDLIRMERNSTIQWVLDQNISEFRRAIEGFIRYFISEAKQSKYLEKLNTILANR